MLEERQRGVPFPADIYDLDLVILSCYGLGESERQRREATDINEIVSLEVYDMLPW